MADLLCDGELVGHEEGVGQQGLDGQLAKMCAHVREPVMGIDGVQQPQRVQRPEDRLLRGRVQPRELEHLRAMRDARSAGGAEAHGGGGGQWCSGSGGGGQWCSGAVGVGGSGAVAVGGGGVV